MKCIIFTEFAEMAKILHRELPNSLMIVGETPALERNKIVEQFNTDQTKKILIGTRAISFGLNLQAATYTINYDLPFSLSASEQRSARAHRMGQKNTVYEYSLIAEKTVDEWVKKKLEAKQELSERIMTISEIKSLLTE